MPIAPALESPATDTAAVVEPGRTSAIAALRYREFRLFWFGLIVSNTGTWMQMFGQGYLVVQLAVRDGVPQLAPLYIGLVGLARAIPGLTFGLFGGVVADRADRRRLLLLTQSLAGITAAALAGLTIGGRIDIVQVILLGAINSLVFSFDAPTRQSMVPRLVPERDLMSAIGLNSAAFNGPQIIGPVIGGLIATAITGNDATDLRGVGWLFALNAVSYLATVTALLLMTPMPVEGVRDVAVFRSIREGLGYIRRDPVIRWVVLLLAATSMLSRPYIQLLPAVANDTLHVGALELSWMLGASGVGSLLGAVATASLGNVRRRGLVLLTSCLMLGVLLVAFGLLRVLAPSLVILALMGFGTMLFLGLSNTLAQTRSPDHLRGRVMSVYSMMQVGLIPLGTMALGSLGSFIGVSTSFIIGGAFVTIVTLYAVIGVPALRNATSQPRHRRSRGGTHHGHREVRSGGAAD
ncbi:MAG: MFS transporter [Chloroflexota bacterium]|nr:MFS transporter [Chloroflexota bacterium]MDE3194659.1 MFS transporter [Chloroflexota bacterium]